MKNRWGMYISLIISICFFCVFGQTVFAKQETIRVGYMDYDSFIEQNEDGTYDGYAAAYLEEISKHTGWEYEYVFDTWENCLEKLKSGEIDLLCSAQYTDERAQFYDYSKYSIGIETTALYTRQDNEQVFYEDFEAFEGIKVALLKDSFQNELMDDYAKENNFSYQRYEYLTNEECFEALIEKEVDAILIGSLASHKNLKVLANFGADPFFIITGKGREEILNPLNHAIAKILNEKPGFSSEIYEKYYGNSAIATQPLFTREEYEYVKNSSPIRIGTMADQKPLSSYVNSSGSFEGIAIDILRVIERISGLRFELEPLTNRESTTHKLEEHTIELVLGAGIIEGFLPDKRVVLSEPFLIDEMVFVGRSGLAFQINSNYTIALPEDFEECAEYIKKTYPNYIIINKSKTEGCLKSVLAGEADLALQNSYLVSYFLQNPHFEGLKVIQGNAIEENLCIAGNQAENKILMSIINKTVAVMDKKEIHQIVANHTIAQPYRYTISDILYKYRLPVGVIVGMLLVVFILFIYILKQKSLYVVTLENKNEQLLDAIVQAEQASRAKGNFLSRMSHEIRTPMNAIVGFTAAAANHIGEPHKVKDYLDKIKLSSKLLLNIINDILDMSAIESEKLKIVSQSFDLKQLMLSISGMYYSQCKQKGIQFDMAISDLTEEILRGDQMRLNQVLLNLLSNAVKFTDRGGRIKLQITQLSKTKEQVFMRFTISDTGCGMNEELIDRLFLPFEQEDGATAKIYGGSGLGLSIAKNLVDLMQGVIKVKSKKGEGTQFTIELPFGIVGKQKETVKFDSFRALVVDDDPNALKYNSLVLERLGVKHDCASSGKEALRLVEESEKSGMIYDICFFDWRMPGIDGIEITKKIRTLDKSKSVIVIVSAYDMNEAEEDAKMAGADMVIAKPLFQSTVFNILINLTGGEFAKRSEDEIRCYDFSESRILLAEDMEINIEIAKELLSDTGVKIDTALDGKEALDKFVSSEAGTYQAVLMDIQMPVMDGYQASMAIRHSGHPDAEKIKIIAMTADAFTEDVSKAFASGMDAHIAKPIEVQVLYDTLNRYLNN